MGERGIIDAGFAGPVKALAIAAAGVMGAFLLGVLFVDAPCDYGEGDTASWIWLLRHGQAIYGEGAAHDMAMVRTNYPPLHLWLVAWLAPSDGTILVAGRLVSIVGFALAVGMVTLTVRRATGSRGASLLGGLLLLGTFRAAFWGGICRADALALGLGTVGVTLASLRVRAWPLFSAVAFAAALLTKQNLIVFPVGTFLWTVRRPEERARGILLALGTGILVGGVLLGDHLVDAVVAGSVAGFQLTNLARHLATSVAPSACAIALVVPLARGRLPLGADAERVAGPWRASFWVGLAWIVTLGRTGADYNYLLELLATLAVLVPIAMSAGGSRRLLLAHLAVAAVEACVWVVGISFFVVRPRVAEEQLARETLRGVDGPVLAEQTYLATSTGHVPVVIPFLATQQAARGLWDAAPLVDAARHGELARVLLGFPVEGVAASAQGWHDERFPPGLLAAVAARYALVAHVDSLYVYAPAAEPTGTSGAASTPR